MISFTLFILSGVALTSLTIAKRIELKGRESSFILRIVSKGDERARDLYHQALHFYTTGKHRVVFVVKKQLPLRAKSYLTKGVLYIKEKGENRFGNIRNSRLISKRDGMKEFFKNISEVEKGAGELHDDFPTPITSAEEPVIMQEVVMEPVMPMVEPVEVVVAPAPQAKKPRAPRKKKVAMIEAIMEVAPAPVITEVKVEPVLEFIPTNRENFKLAPRKRRLKVVEEVE
jgi:hypothetical protein